MSACEHAIENDELPCPWPGCASGTPQAILVLMRGDEGVMTYRRHGQRLAVEAEGGCETYRRQQVAAGGWRWVKELG